MGFCYHCGNPLIQEVRGVDYDWDLYVGPSESGDFGVARRDLSRSMIVYGSVGSGKTTFVTRLLLETRVHGMGFLLLDYEGEYREVAEELDARVLEAGGDSAPLRLALLEPAPGVPWEAHAEWAYSVLAGIIVESGWTLTPQMEFVLNRAVRRAVREKARLGELPAYIEAAARGVPGGVLTAVALAARLSRVTEGPLTSVLESPSTLGDPLRGRLILDLHTLALASSLDARIAVLVALYRARQALLARRPRDGPPRSLVVVEEAESALAPGLASSRIMEEIIIHGRKKGVTAVIVAHSPLLIDRRIQSIAGNYAVFRLDGYRDALEAANTLGDQSLESEIRSLSRGQMLLKTISLERPVKVIVDPLARRGDLVALLESIARYPHLTTRERRALLGWDGARFRRVVEEAKRRRLIEERYAYRGAGRPVKLLQLRGMNPSAPHRYGERQARALAREVLGVEAKTGWPAGPDLYFEYAGKRIAVEVETGTNINLGKLLARAEDYDLTIIVCVDRRCLGTARRAAAQLPEGVVAVATITTLKTILSRLREDRGLYTPQRYP